MVSSFEAARWNYTGINEVHDKTTSRNKVIYKCYWIITITIKDINTERTSYLLIVESYILIENND